MTATPETPGKAPLHANDGAKVAWIGELFVDDSREGFMPIRHALETISMRVGVLFFL